jgi:uncharacterized protein DUF4160
MGRTVECASFSHWFSLCMPTILRIGPYRFFFFAGDRAEPPHVHVEREDAHAKIWLNPVRLHDSGGLRRSEINRVVEMARQNEDHLMRSWNEYFAD